MSVLKKLGVNLAISSIDEKEELKVWSNLNRKLALITGLAYEF